MLDTPISEQAIGSSVERTNRLVVVQESPLAGSWGATVVAAISANWFDSLDAAPVLVSAPDAPVPYAGVLEDGWLPSAERIVSAVRRLVEM